MKLRGFVLSALGLAIWGGVGCSSFGETGADSNGADSGTPTNGDDDDDTDPTTGDGTCRSTFSLSDAFDREVPNGDAWGALLTNGGNALNTEQFSTGYALKVETEGTDTDSVQTARLGSAAFTMPTSGVRCTFRILPRTPFTTERGQPIDIFGFRLTYGTGNAATQSVYRVTYDSDPGRGETKARLGLRFGDSKGGDACSGAGCSIEHERATDSTMSPGVLSTVTVRFSLSDFSASDGTFDAMRRNVVEPPASVEVLFGLESYSPYAQEVLFDDLECREDC